MLEPGAILLLAVGLAMDSVSVALALGLELRRERMLHASKLSMSFGAFHIAMPLLGWLLGLSIMDLISMYDHWVAFLILCLVGGAMLLAGEADLSPLGSISLFGLSLATSIDAAAVGLSLYLERVSILSSSVVIGLVVALLTFLAALAGERVGQSLGKWTRVIGGFILISVGLRILMIHLSS